MKTLTLIIFIAVLGTSCKKENIAPEIQIDKHIVRDGGHPRDTANTIPVVVHPIAKP